MVKKQLKSFFRHISFSAPSNPSIRAQTLHHPKRPSLRNAKTRDLARIMVKLCTPRPLLVPGNKFRDCDIPRDVSRIQRSRIVEAFFAFITQALARRCIDENSPPQARLLDILPSSQKREFFAARNVSPNGKCNIYEKSDE